MKVKFKLLKNNVSWDTVIHQLNSDILLRHLLLKGNVDDMNVSFSYCESTSTGRIQNKNSDILGSFFIFS